MRSAIARITLKIIELLGCVACFVTKIITDLEARRVFLRNPKYSREWSLLHNVTWSSAGNTFANITYGGFSLITTLMLISRCIDANSRPSVIEKIFLIVGMLCFFAMGGIVLAAFDQVPWELHDNSIILGCLSFFVALVMLYDLSDPMARHVTDTTQTDTQTHAAARQSHSSSQPQQQQQQPQITTPMEPVPIDRPSVTTQTTETTQTSVTEMPAHRPIQPAKETVVKMQSEAVQTTAVDSMTAEDIAKNGNYRRGDTIDFVQYQQLPQPEQPVFERVLLPEKKRPTFQRGPETHKNAIVQTVPMDMEYMMRDEPINHRHRDASLHYTQMPKYAAVQRPSATQYVERVPTVAQPQYLDQVRPNYAPAPAPMYKLSRGYELSDYERPPPRHTIKTTTTAPPPRNEELNRYRDPAADHYQNPPMMVIRNYAQPMSAPPTNINERRTDPYHRNGGNIRKPITTQHTQITRNSRKNGTCCNDDDVDFRKMNAAMRPGFVQTVAKMWDRRAVENSAEFNTIV